MYCPAHFSEDRTPVLHDAIRRTGLANLVTLGPEGLTATPLPLLLDPTSGSYGTLRGHMARANPQWRRFSTDVPTLAIFMGPHAYVSPSWYPSKRETGKAVPTWNYVTVHAHGPLEIFDDPDLLRDDVAALSARHEAGRPDAWAVSDAPKDFIEAMLKGIVGFRMTITRLEGKWKMSQNRPAPDRDGVVRGLRCGNEDERRVADIVAGVEVEN